MFDIGFSELILLGFVALIVLGPEKLPVAMRTLGRYYAKFKHTLTHIQDTFDQELKIAELREQMQQELQRIKQTELRMREELDKMNAEIHNNKQQTIEPQQSSIVVQQQDIRPVNNGLDEIVASAMIAGLQQGKGTSDDLS
ncbi:MAG: Sec-independent protein translocase protein TatB [Acinetobacter sp.]